jgi:hypothetical protein
MLENEGYIAKIYVGYQYLWQVRYKILKEQLALDPLQDSVLETAFDKAVSYGNNNLKHSHFGLHQLLHHVPLPYGFDAHSFGIEFLLHSGVKFIATLAFPLIYPLLNDPIVTDDVPGIVKSVTTQSVKFFGINPLEGVHTVKSFFAENTTMHSILDNFSYGEGYHLQMAENSEFREVITSYQTWMESVDAAMHVIDEFSILYNNRDLPHIPLVSSLYLHARGYLYEQTKAEEERNELIIQSLKDGADHVEEDLPHYMDWQLIYGITKGLQTAYTIYQFFKVMTHNEVILCGECMSTIAPVSLCYKSCNH